ncbi:hypothetical protein JCM3774_006145 [Rhodotorula dairenensis]
MRDRLENPYDRGVDYAELAASVLHPDLSVFLQTSASGRSTLDFRDEAALRALNGALLKRDFDLEVELPPDRLCPSVPGRLDYVLHCLELVRQTRRRQALDTVPETVTGLDVGTGASAIYPLLAVRYAASSRAPREIVHLQMLATDINEASIAVAKRNVDRNRLTPLISVHRVEPDGPIFPPVVIDAASSIDFTMCNPPFYASAEEIASSEAGKARLPFAICTGADNEMVTPGGEVAFVSRMIQGTPSLGPEKIRWFTSLLGKYSSIAPLVDELKKQKILNYHVSALPTRGHTTRWVLSWSLQEWRIPPVIIKDTLARDSTPPIPPAPSFPLRRFLSPWTAPLLFIPARASDSTISGPGASDTVISALRNALDELARSALEASVGRNFEWVDEGEESNRNSGDGAEPDYAVFITAMRNVWSRQARRAAAAAADSVALPSLEASSPGKAEPPPSASGRLDGPPRQSPVLELRIELWTSTSSRPDGAGPSLRLEGWWVRGSDRDRSALEGLWSFLTRRIGDDLRRKAEEGEKGTLEVEVDGKAGGKGGAARMDGENGEAGAERRKKRKL